MCRLVAGQGDRRSCRTRNCCAWSWRKCCWASPSARHWLPFAHARLRHLFPYLPQQSGHTKRLNAAGPLISYVIEALARQVPSWHDDLRLIDSAPLPCAASRETVKRSELAGHTGYGYRRSHSRFFWGFRLYLLTTAEGMPVTWCLASPKLGERRCAVLGPGGSHVLPRAEPAGTGSKTVRGVGSRAAHMSCPGRPGRAIAPLAGPSPLGTAGRRISGERLLLPAPDEPEQGAAQEDTRIAPVPGAMTGRRRRTAGMAGVPGLAACQRVSRPGRQSGPSDGRSQGRTAPPGWGREGRTSRELAGRDPAPPPHGGAPAFKQLAQNLVESSPPTQGCFLEARGALPRQDLILPADAGVPRSTSKPPADLAACTRRCCP